MGSIQGSSMMMERSGKPGRFSFFPKGALTHHPEGNGETEEGERQRGGSGKGTHQTHTPHRASHGLHLGGRRQRVPATAPAAEDASVSD